MNRHRIHLRHASFTLALLAAGPAFASGELISAVQDGLDAQVKSMVAHHADVNATDGTGATALSWAVMRGDAATAALLLKAHADPNLADANGVTPLMLAMENNSPQMVKLILDNAGNPNQARPNGETPLMSAIRLQSPDMLTLLLAAHADVNARESQFGQTALMWAAGQPQMVRLLLDRGADTTPVTKSWDVTSVIYTNGVSTLGVTGIPWNNDGEYTGKAGGLNALMFAVQKGDQESVKLLLDKGMDVNFAAADGTTPLLASLYNFAHSGAPTAPNANAPMTYAPNLAIANLLLDHGANVNAADRAGYTPLHGAVLALVAEGKGRIAPIGFVAGKRSMPNAPAPKPPANEEAGLAVVARLLDKGADPNKATLYTTPGPIGSLRVNPASPGSTPYHLAGAAHSARLIDMMAAHGANPNQLRKDGHTPFSIAAISNDLPVVQAMVAHGADVQMRFNPADKIADPVLSVAEARKNETILHVAGISGANYVVEYLASKGAPLDAKNDHGETPFEIADKQERFRYAHDVEGPHGVGAESAKGVTLGLTVTRETQTTEAFRRAMGKKTKLASN